MAENETLPFATECSPNLAASMSTASVLKMENLKLHPRPPELGLALEQGPQLMSVHTDVPYTLIQPGIKNISPREILMLLGK